MTIWWLYVIVFGILFLGMGFIYLVLKLNQLSQDKSSPSSDLLRNLDQSPEKELEYIFNKEFREELRNRARLRFEKVIQENAMFLQQDLRLTASQLNQYMKDEISQTLKNEFSKYEQSINDAKQLAVESIQKTLAAIEDQRKTFTEQIKDEVSKDKERMIARFEDRMTDIINHYLLEAIGDQVDLDSQFEYIISDLENSKKDIIEDLKNG